MKRVLVFPCGSEIGLEINRSIEFSTHFKVFGGSSVDDHGKFVYENYIDGIPQVDDHDFIEKLNDVIEYNKIDYIFPAHDSVVLKLMQESTKLACKIITSPLKTCEITRSKLKTYEYFEGVIPTPTVLNRARLQKDNFPVFLKPDIGQGSKGTYIAKTSEDIDFYIKEDNSLMILEYLPGKEYTIDCFTNKKGDLLYGVGRERKRISNGISVSSKVSLDKRFKELATKINGSLEFRGVWFFQVKERADGQLVLMEIAPRIAGTMGLARARGVNLALLSLFDAMDYDVDIFENNYNIVIDRSLQNSYLHNINYEHVYLDFDDLVIMDDKVNADVITFIFECINNKIKTHLITKHKENIHETLSRYRLSDIFDEIIWLKEGDEKYKSITERKSIFIDDSFSERKIVHEKLGIPTFDAHMIESLLK